MRLFKLLIPRNQFTMKKNCIECGESFTGRSDKIFCSDHCRTAHYNRQNSDVTNLMRNVNRILRKNRRILEEHNPDGKARVHKSTLLRKGFNFDYCTSTYTTKSGKTYVFCYDQGYLPLGSNYYALVLKEAYLY